MRQNIYLGDYQGKRVETNGDVLENGGISEIGLSGAGKSVELQKISIEAVKGGASVLVLDMHGTMDPDQILPAYAADFNKYTYEVNKDSSGIRIPYFTPLGSTGNYGTCQLDLIEAITNDLGSAFHVGCSQKAELRNAVCDVAESGSYQDKGIHALDEFLQLAANKTADKVREKLHPLTAHNIFVHGDDFYKEGRINIFRFSQYSLDVQQIIAEILTAYIWRLANAGYFKEKGIYIVIDECQNMPSNRESVLAQMLSEGRKFGVNLVLATQMIPQRGSSPAMQRMSQCAVQLYFKPASSSVLQTAKAIDPVRQSDWVRKLNRLGIGEFIAVGKFFVNGRPYNEPLVVSSYVDSALLDSDETRLADSGNRQQKL